MDGFRIKKFVKSIIFIIFIAQFITISARMRTHAVEVEEMPLTGKLEPTGETEYRVLVVEGNSHAQYDALERRRRQLAAFQLCLLCKCCSDLNNCATVPCCFGIDCQLPNKPYGVCAFVPKTCNCSSCATV